MGFVSSLDHLVRDRGFSLFGWAPLDRPLSMDIYYDWLKADLHAGMEYLRDHARLKENPQAFIPRAKSALVVARSYLPHPYPATTPPKSLRTALYARGEDYHSRFHTELEALARDFKSVFPSEEFLCFVDSAPILERDLAYRAGLGWFGKNTCLIHPHHGSLFFLGQILTSIDLHAKPPHAPVADHCGTCDRCIQACPTGALEEPRRLNANKCIAYWTIEARDTAPPEIRTRMGDWFFGCDICQTVCPWNEKFFGRETMRGLTNAVDESRAAQPEADLTEDLRWVLSSSARELRRRLGKSPLIRARPLGLKRNALIVIGNRDLVHLRPEVQAAMSDPRLRELAEWTMSRLDRASRRTPP